MVSLADRAFTDRALREAWADVLKRDGRDGALTAGVERFEADLDNRIGALVRDLAWQTYQPQRLTEVTLPGDARVLHIPSVGDRVVERAIYAVILPLVDPVLGPSSFAYRPGLGVADAVQDLARQRDEGLGWVLLSDVDDCFPSIPVRLARRKLGALVTDTELLDVVDLLLNRQIHGGRGNSRYVRGLAQGCALSPLLSNLVLVDLDDALLDAGFAVVRYADNLAVTTADKDDAWEALRIASRALEAMAMSLGDEDTKVMSFDEGFSFLGEDFGPRYPPVLEDHRVQEPDQKVVYVARSGGRVRVARGRLLVQSHDDAELLSVPTSQVSRIVLFGSVGLTAGARSWAMATGVDVALCSRRGSYLGSLVSAEPGSRVSRLRAQLAIQNSPKARQLGQTIVEAKLRKQVVVLQRLGRREHAEVVEEAIREMRQALILIPDAQTTDELTGLEGAAAAAYFPALGSLLPEGLTFTHRTRQPPLDLPNAVLSFLYTILTGECVAALVAAGLDPAIGVLHSDADRRPSLALDLVEEFRPQVVDQVLVQLTRQGTLTAGHARTEEDRAGILLTKAGRDAVLTAYERRMLTTTKGALPDFSGTLRRHLYRQAQRLGGAIVDPDREFTGLAWRP